MIELDDRLVTLDEVAKALSVSRPTAARWVRAGVLPSVKVGGARRVRLRDLEKVIAGEVVA